MCSSHLHAAAVEIYFDKSVHIVNESDGIIFINVVAIRRQFFGYFSAEIKPFINKTLKPYYGM